MARALTSGLWGILVLGLIAGPADAASDVTINVCILAQAQSCFSAFAAGFEVTNVEGSSGGGGGGATEATYSVLSVVKATDPLSPTLFLWATSGIHFPQVVVTVTPKDQPSYTITLTQASIARFKSAAAVGQQTAQEIVDFRYFQVCLASGNVSQCGGGT